MAPNVWTGHPNLRFHATPHTTTRQLCLVNSFRPPANQQASKIVPCSTPTYARYRKSPTAHKWSSSARCRGVGILKKNQIVALRAQNFCTRKAALDIALLMLVLLKHGRLKQAGSSNREGHGGCDSAMAANLAPLMPPLTNTLPAATGAAGHTRSSPARLHCSTSLFDDGRPPSHQVRSVNVTIRQQAPRKENRLSQCWQ